MLEIFFAKNVDLRDIASEIRVEFTNSADLVRAIMARQSLLTRVERWESEEAVWEAAKIQSIVDTTYLVNLRKNIASTLSPILDERAYLLRPRCISISEFFLKV